MQADLLGTRVTAAIDGSGKPRAQIIAETGISKSELSRLENGHSVNPGREVLASLAEATGTTVGYLHGDPVVLPPEDREELERHRNWIDSKLPKIDARAEPNAVLVVSAVDDHEPGQMIADRPQVTLDVPNVLKRRNVQHILRARGDSMSGVGIMNKDTLYAIAAPRMPPIEKIIACRLDGKIYVKRVGMEHSRYLLISENPRYQPIEFDPKSPDFEMIGVVIGRVGAVD